MWLHRNDSFQRTPTENLSTPFRASVVLPELSTVEQQMEKARERSIKWYHNMTDEQKAERNAKKRASRERSRSNARTIIASNEDQTDVICVTPFGTGASEVDDQITLKEVKREKDKRRYLEMADTSKHEKILNVASKKGYPNKVNMWIQLMERP
ncbi:hypothetical protein PVAP13_1KG381500 [Panicum virgatum]|uniref:Uncharacterized protein n=1 Tax=Panicum virgatum TaxID=38727 RepID=A0A8T0XX16_PANVG|nr:hypothetical protein PVAP13_1KG381500 [Panicum virgatum]